MKIIFILISVIFGTSGSVSQISRFPYSERFDSVTAPALPAGWISSVKKNPSGDFSTSTSSPRTGSLPNCVSATDARADQHLISPLFDFTGKIVDSIIFYERRSGTFTAGVLIEAAAGSDSLFSIRISDTLKLTTLNNGAYQRRALALPEILGNQQQVRFRWRVAGAPGGGATALLRLDDFSVKVKTMIDLSIQSFSFTPLLPKKGDTVSVSVIIANRALAGNFSGTVRLFDSLTLVHSVPFDFHLAQFESTIVRLRYNNISPGVHPLTVLLETDGDEELSNNSTAFSVSAGYRERTMLINEIMYSPQGGMPEWIELINNSSDTIPASGWKISDAGTVKASFLPVQRSILPYDYVVVTTDTVSFKSFYSNSPQLFLASFSSLNNSGDAVVLYDRNNTVIDTLYYSPSWGGGTGISLERIDTSLSSLHQLNWKSSRHPGGATPGAVNSNTKKSYDAALAGIHAIPGSPVAGEPFTLHTIVLNAGREPIQSAVVKVFYDSNGDSIFAESERLHEEMITGMNPNDSAVIAAAVTMPQGRYRYAAVVSAIRDDDESNNFFSKIVAVGISPKSIVINEIMYAPPGDVPEWVEAFNTSPHEVTISGWSLSDNGTSRGVISSAANIPGQSYFIMTTDSQLFSQTYPASVPIFQTAFPALNNTTQDAVVLRDDRGITIDSIVYHPRWGGANGHSLQRYDVLAASTDSINWRSNAPTAGAVNSVTRKNHDIEIRRVSTERISGGIRITAVVANPGRNTASSVIVRCYESTSLTGAQQSGEMIYRTDIAEILPRDSVILLFDLNSQHPGKHSIVVAAEFEQDEDTRNNMLSAFGTIQYPHRSIVISEILYEPKPGNAEFVELYNRSNDSIDVSGWMLMDQPGASGNRSKISLTLSAPVMHPGRYILVASDSSLFNQFPLLNRASVVIYPSLSLSNSGEDLLLVDPTGTVIDSLRYSPAWHLKNSVSSGRSLERIDLDGISTDGRNWSSSVAPAGSTPLRINSIFVNPTVPASSLSLSPNPFSPDRDGFEDFLSIRYTLPAVSATIRIRIFDITGRLIRRLADRELSPSSGSVIWNGDDDDGNRVRIGMYIILLEALDHFGGTAAVMKDVAVVGRKL